MLGTKIQAVFKILVFLHVWNCSLYLTPCGKQFFSREIYKSNYNNGEERGGEKKGITKGPYSDHVQQEGRHFLFEA